MLLPPVPRLEPAFDVEADLGPLEDHGDTRAGHRRIIPVSGGRVSGGIIATLVPGGADWQIVRPDGSIEIDCRYSARTDADEWLYLQVRGVRSGDPEVLSALLRGEAVAPDAYYFRTSIHIETSAPRLAHLEKSVFVASCVRAASSVAYRAYRVT